ncbi:MAG: putative lipid II flippase FtsW [Oligoflexia bacterium]|nr:putative lipid II flippase FtsW [Oligoflexia bacterium]
MINKLKAKKLEQKESYKQNKNHKNKHNQNQNQKQNYSSTHDTDTTASNVDKLPTQFLFTAFILILVGVIMVYSSSYIYAKEVFHNSSYFFFRQLIFSTIGILLIFSIQRIKFDFWYKHGLKIGYFVFFLLLLTIIPGIAPKLKGAHRWLKFGFFYIQPGEFIKYTLLFPAIYLFDNFDKLTNKERLNYTLCLLFPLLILSLQPDFGTFSICILVIAFVWFLSSFSRKFLYGFISVGSVIGIILIFVSPYRIQRILTFLDPWKDPQKSGFQIIQSYLAFANGGILGKGIGNSEEKLFYLPEAHNDFIFSVTGEELGFVGIVFLVITFIILTYLGFKMAIRSQKRPNMILIASVIFTIALQAFLNMGVVLGLLPTKGLNLPFISYGGSSIISNCFAIGLMMSAYKNGLQSESVKTDTSTHVEMENETENEKEVEKKVEVNLPQEI